MLVDTAPIDIDEVIKAGPIRLSLSLRRMLWTFVCIGITAFVVALFSGYDLKILWGAYYHNLVFFMGLSAGSVMISVISQIVGARWSVPIRRIAEANVSFLPWAWILLLSTWAGRVYLFPWAQGPMPGKEIWMQDWFVYLRIAVLLGFLFFMLWRFVKMSIRSDIGMLMEHVDKRGMESWRAKQGFFYNFITKNWGGSNKEIPALRQKMNWNAPVLVIFYAIIYSLFAFEMVMAMDPHWISNMFGGFIFIGNIYLGWATVALICNQIAAREPAYAKVHGNQQRWDLGKMTFAFCMLWGYLFFSQFLPQWYGNLPEETQWLILRMRDWNGPWIRLAWVVFPMCFIIPFILLLSRDVKRNPVTQSIVGVIIFVGIWLERYLIIMPNLSPHRIPFDIVDISLFLGFLGGWGLSVQSFLTKVPFLQISHPSIQDEA